MTDSFTAVIAIVDTYLVTGEFMPLWTNIAGPDLDASEEELMTPTEQQQFWVLYELVYMGQQESATPVEKADGLIGGAELQARIRSWRDAAAGAAS